MPVIKMQKPPIMELTGKGQGSREKVGVSQLQRGDKDERATPFVQLPRRHSTKHTWTFLSHHNPLGQVCEPCVMDTQTDQSHTTEDGIWAQCQAPHGPHSTVLSSTGTSQYKGITFKGTRLVKMCSVLLEKGTA